MGASPATLRAPQALPINAGLSRRRFRCARIPAQPGVYARLPAWRGRVHWVGAVLPAALAKRGRLDRHYPVAHDTACKVAGVLAAAADHRTGRHSRPTVAAIAEAAGYCERTAQRALKLLEALGVVVRVQEGRSVMTRAERLSAWRAGSSTRKLAAEFALVVPRDLAAVVHRPGRSPVDDVTPPAYSVGERVSYVRFEVLRDRKDRKDEPRCARRPPPRARPVVRPATLRAYRLIAGVQKAAPWLSHVSPRRLTSLHRFAAHGWTPRDVARSIEHVLRARGWTIPDELTQPAAYLACLLRELDPADRPGAIDEQLAAELEIVAAWRASSPECEHGLPAGNTPHPTRGYLPCPMCRAAASSLATR